MGNGHRKKFCWGRGISLQMFVNKPAQKEGCVCVFACVQVCASIHGLWITLRCETLIGRRGVASMITEVWQEYTGQLSPVGFLLDVNLFPVKHKPCVSAYHVVQRLHCRSWADFTRPLLWRNIIWKRLVCELHLFLFAVLRHGESVDLMQMYSTVVCSSCYWYSSLHEMYLILSHCERIYFHFCNKERSSFILALICMPTSEDVWTYQT